MRLGAWWCAAGGIRAARCGEGSGEIKASRRKAQIDTQWEEKKKAAWLLIYLLTGGGTG
jgi:hypothetical protein